MKLNEAVLEFDYMLKFTEIYKNTEDKYLREAKLLKIQTKHILKEMTKDELIVGASNHGLLGFSPQYGGLYVYFYHNEIAEELFEKYKNELSNKDEIREMMSYWEKENSLKKLNDRFSQKHPELEIYKKTGGKMGFAEKGVGTGLPPTGRLALTIPNIDKLINLGIPGLRDEIKRLNTTNNTFMQACEVAVETIVDAIDFYLVQAKAFLKDDSQNQDLINLVNCLENIKVKKPESFYEGIQLHWIYAVISDQMNHGRMDEFLGDLYVKDLEAGIIDEEIAIRYLTDLYRQYKYINKMHDTRVVVGGKGRRNEKNADKLAMVIMETSRRFKDIVPQLTLRYYKGMDEALFDKGLQVNAEGCSFPLLYSDDANIPNVMKSFDVSEEDAQSYIPAGCGEYILEGKSVGTPNSGINLTKGLELALHNGRDSYLNVVAGPDTGDLESFKTFEDLWSAYAKQVELEVEIVAWAEKDCYDIISENAGFLHLSLLMDDCLLKQKAMIDGGVRYLNGSTEVMGMMTAADSLSAIKKLVYDDKVMTLRELVNILDADFVGYEKERKMMQDCPKYGNDDDEADAMAKRVLEHVAHKAQSMTDVIKINQFQMVSVNNSASAEWGGYTSASACGRKTGDALANANSASIGCDKAGITSLLNSMSKFDHSVHAGVINNVRFTKELFKESYDKIKMLIRTFFENNGTQLNLMVIGKDDLMNAQKNPEKYQNLIVRIGGFSARFVELDPIVQTEIIRRTTYEAS